MRQHLLATGQAQRVKKLAAAESLAFDQRPDGAVVVVDDVSLQMAAEEALSREIAARGPDAVPSYRLIPRPELANKDSAKAWLERLA